MDTPRYVAITGGVGGAKLCLGLSRILGPDELAFVVNAGDDFEHLGLHVSPDIDTLVYTLSEEANPDLGWGRRGETWNFMEALARLGGETWFRLGDKDLAMHVERTRRLAAGQTLSEVTMQLASALGIRHRVLPMSDERVSTRVVTGRGALDFQHYFVRERCEPVVRGFEFAGAERARPNRDLLAWLDRPELRGVIICPSNPFVSIEPILALQGLRECLARCPARVIAVSPVVGGKAIKGPTVKMMNELGLPNTAEAVARRYADFLDGFILDARDDASRRAVEDFGLAVEVTNTVMTTLEDKTALARACLQFIERLV